MIRRWRWHLALAGLVLAGIGYAHDGARQGEDPYRDRPSRHVLPSSAYKPIPPQNYKIAPPRAPQSGNVQWRKNGLFDPRQFHQQLQQRQQRTRAPRWDRDITNAAPDEMHPVYNPGAAKMYFSSNAGGVGPDGRLINPTPRYRIWRGDLDEGSQTYLSNLTNLTPITGDTPDEQFGSQIQPAINEPANIIAYANRSAAGSYNIVVRNLSTGQRVVLTSDNNGITQNLRPTLSPGGNLVIFSSNRLLAGETEADRRYRLYVARTDGRPFEDGTFFRRITFPDPGENDVEPAWSPDGSRVAFARIATDGSSYIYVLDFNTLTVVQWTTFVDADGNRPRDRQPTWAQIGDTPYIVFSSTRKSGQPHQLGRPSDRVDVNNNIYDIYYLPALLPEPPSAANTLSLTTDPSTAALARPDVPGVAFFAPTAGAKYPTAAIDTRNRVAYHSTRTQGAEPPGPGVHDLWETLVFDLTPPLVEVLPVVSPKEMFPGDTVTIKVRALDLQSGIDFVRVQFKDPDSAEQDAVGEEHKLYQLFQFDPLFPNRILVEQGQAYVPLFVEVGQQAIHPQTYEYKDPYSLVRLGFNGSLDDTLLLQPELDDNGNPTDWYVATWRTPDIPSDFYLDVIVRDNAGNEFIYDNISGFTTQPFTGAHNILLVSDYMGGQIFVQNRVDVIGNSITRPTWQPVESYWTDNPTGKPPFDVTQPPSGQGTIIHGDGAIPHPNLPPGFFIRSDTLGQNTTYGNLYSIWRVQCRNPITPAVLAGYQPRTEREPTDLAGGFRDKLHAPRMVIWASPYTGNVWAGPGHILDPEVQTLIRNFLQGSGRILFSGQDIAWALSLRGSVANQFMNDILRVSFDSDTADDVFAIPYRGLRHELQGILGDPQRGEDPNPFAENPAGIIIWVRYEGNTIVPDSPLTLRLSHPAAYLVFPTFDLFDVIQPLGATSSTPLYTDAAWNQVWLDTVSVATTARVPYTYTQPRVGSGTLLGTSDQAGSYYINDANRSKVAFMAFGIEGVNSAYSQGPQDLLWCRSLRNKIIHNAFGWMTHSVLEGVVRQYDPDTRTFTPLPRALVRVIGVAPLSLVGVNAGYAITDSNGFYRIVGLEAGAYIVDAERPGFKTQHPETFVLVAETARINLIMLATPPGQISGRVIDINNQPVRGALVRATNTTDPELTREIVTDPDGTFLIPRVPVGTWDVTVVGLAFGGYTLPPVQPAPDGVYRGVQVRSGETTNVGDFVLEPEPGTVTGTVTDANTGNPIPNARITAVAGTNTRADVTTDANGVYSFSVPAGEYVITAVAPGYAPESQTLTVPANTTTTLNFQLSLLPPGSASGRIVRRFGGAPEPGVTVRLRFGTVDVQTTTTDPNGNYSFTNVPPGEYVVIPEKSGFTFIPNQRTIIVNPNQNTVVGEFKSEPLRTFFKGRFLVSAPYDYLQDVRELLAVPASATFRFFTWNPSQSRYVFYPNAPANRFQLGRGYFIETSEDLPLTTVGTAADTSQPFQIPLQPGWNLVGNPFTFDVDWGQVQVIDPDTNTAVSLPTAVGKGIIANALWGYSFDSYLATTRMKVWEGYWVYAYRATTLIIPPSAAATSASSRSANPNATGWRLTLEVQSGDLKDRAYIGVLRSATAGYDREHDLLKPPPIGADYVHISLPRLNWGAHSGVYGVDIQPATRSASWEFVVESSQPNREVTLRWPDAQQLPRTANLVLVNLETGERRYLRTTGAYTFRTNASGVSRFRLELASSSGLLRIQQVQVQSGRGSQHTITFQLTGDATVQVNILAGGKVVRQLLNQATRSGVQQATWDGRNQNGVALPPGTYTVEIRAVSDDGQVARATAPLVLTR